MRAFLLTFAVLIAVLLTAGCVQLGLGGKKDKGAELPELYVGTEGLVVGFAPESIPSTVTSESSSDVVLLVANKGAVDVPEAIITVKDTRGAFTLEKVSGGEVFAFEKQLIKLEKPLQGKESSASAVGAVEGLTLTLKAKKVNDTETGFLTSTCYRYGTKLTANVCIDASSYSFQKQSKPCDAKAPIALKSQGAPVAVKKIETILEKSGNVIKPKFKIYIGNIGNGLIIDKTKLNLFCTAEEPEKAKDASKPKLNVVTIEKVELNNKELACSEKEKVLSGNAVKDFVLCAYDYSDFTEGSGTFVTPLKVELSYGYTSTSVPVPVKIEKGF